MKIPAPANMWNIVLVLPSLVAVLQTTTAQKNGIDIYSLNVDSKVSSRFAHTVITSRVVNKADAAQEATFQMELPKKAFITNFSMIIDGVTYPGNIKDKATAQEQYRAAVGRGESAGLVKATGRKTEQFEVSVSVAPAAKVTFELVYEELLKRHLGVYELLLKVRPQQLVKHLQMDIHIFEPQGISFLETESTFMTKELEDALTTSQNKTKAHIQFKPTLAQQQKSPDKQETVLDGNFIVRYDVNRSRSVGSIQIENGYFVHYFAPEDLPIMPKNVIFVIDKSSSMFGRKIQQTREALIKILKDLSPKDQFNIIVFSGEASQWKPSLVRASAENVREATGYASRIQARGGTNINDAMLMAVKLLDRSNRAELLPEGSVSLIILLTDGDPTVGETNPKIIQKNVQEAINSQYSLFCLGFGFDVSYSFLEKLAMDNGGLARRIYEDSDSALQLQDFYQEVANPLLSAVAFEYPSNAVEAVTQDNFRLLFKGSEIVVAGKIRDEGPDVLSAKVRGQTHMQNITFQGEANVAQQEEEFRSPKYIFHNFMERLWAYLTIQQQLEQRVSASDAEIKTLEAKALNLSLKYNFVTPLTSMVVTKPEGQEQSQIAEKPAAEKPVEYDDGLQLAYIGSGPLAQIRDVGARLTWLQGGSHADPLSTLRRGFHRQGAFDPPSFKVSIADTHRMVGQPGPPMHSFLAGSPYSDLQTDLRLLSHVTSAPSQPVLNGPTIQDQVTDPPQAIPIILPFPGLNSDPLCVDLPDLQGPMNLFSDPSQGTEVTGQYETEKDGFAWIEVTFKDPQLQVHATPERVVVTRNQKNSEYKWKETLFSVLPGLKMTMDNKGLLLFTGQNKVTIGLLSGDGPGKGLLLLLRDTHHFSSHVNGTLGQFYQDLGWESPVTADDNRGTLRVQGRAFPATRELKMDYQEGFPGTKISCWSVKL